MRESFQNEFQGLCEELNLKMEDVAVLFLASQGLLLMELLNLSFLTPSQIRKVTQRMLNLVEELDPGPASAGDASSRRKDGQLIPEKLAISDHAEGLNS